MCQCGIHIKTDLLHGSDKENRQYDKMKQSDKYQEGCHTAGQHLLAHKMTQLLKYSAFVVFLLSNGYFYII